MCKKHTQIIILALFLCSIVSGLAYASEPNVYTVTSLSDTGSGTFDDCLTKAENDNIDSIILFGVNGTITRSSGRYNVTEPNLIVCGSTAGGSGITFDFNANSGGFRLQPEADNVQFVDIKVQNTLTNADGFLLLGPDNCVFERCTFYRCRDEAVGITSDGSGDYARNTIVAFCRIDECGSQSDPYPDGRGILITYNSSGILVGNSVYHCARGITVNTANSFMDVRNTRVEYSLSPSSGSGITDAGSSSNMIDCVSSYNANSGFRWKNSCTFYRDNLSGTGNAYYLESADGDCTEVNDPITVLDTPFPYWLQDATTPDDGDDVGMGTGIPHCLKPCDPSPAYKSVGVDLSATLSWSPAQVDSNSYDVYFGTSFSDVNTATTASGQYKGNQQSTTYDQGTLSKGTTYYWRIDNVGVIDTWKGDIWQFTTVSANQASEPSPADEATGVDIDVILRWQPGADANSHNVYFGTSESALEDANQSSAEYMGNQDSNSYDPNNLEYSCTYYWSIDEVNDSNGVTAGNVWSFSVMQDPNLPAVDYYVGPNGNDNDTGTSIANAWATIQKAADTLVAGETVLVMPGTYAEYVLTGNAGTSGNPITYRAYYEAGDVIVDANDLTQGIKSNDDYIVIDGFTCKYSNNNGILIAGEYNIVRNCITYGNTNDGIRFDAGDYSLAENCLTYDNGDQGIGAIGQSDNLDINNCTIYGNADDGIYCSSSDTDIMDCIIAGNGAWGIDTYGTVAVTIDYSDVYNNSNGHYDVPEKITEGGNCIHSDPCFVDAANDDFELDTGSPCIDAASDGGDMGYRYDESGPPSPPGKATNPSPANSAANVAIDADLSWSASGAETYDVYFGTSSPGAAQGEQAGNTFDPGTMSADTTYYWRIDANNTAGKTTGDVWSFTTVDVPGQASSPSPADDATDVSTSATLSWTAGSQATSHDVYFGTSSPGTFQGNQAGTTFNPGTLSEETTYYWRIDEKNSAGTTTGSVWDFTTGSAPAIPEADYYVDDVNGNDTNSGTSPAQAWATIGKAADTLTAGETVLVYPGTYAEYVITGNSGTSGSPITYRAYYEAGDVIIDATGLNQGIRANEQYIIIDGFECKNSNNNGIIATDHYVTIRNCICYDNTNDGIRFDGGDYGLAENCLVYDNGDQGIGVIGNSDNVDVNNCTIYSNDDDGMYCANSDTDILDCIIVDNGAWGIDTYGTVAVTIDYSDVYNNSSGHYDDTNKVTEGNDCIHSDPNFVDPGNDDFHLDTGSPCIDAASDNGDMGYRYND